MNLPDYVPSPVEAVEMLSRVHPQLQPAFENAYFEATNYIETKKLSCDINTLCMLVRLHVKNHLVKLGIEGVEFDNYSLQGISFKESGAHWRVWKAEDHELPAPGSSGKRKAYYNQQYVLQFDGEPKIERINKFAILWNLGPGSKITLWLVCPKYYDDETKKSDCWWYVAIPDSTLNIPADTEIGKPSSDLPMEGKKEKKRETDGA